MKLLPILTLTILSLSALQAQASDYEVRFGGKTYIVKEGEALEVVTPKGEKVELVVTKQPILLLEVDGLSFSHSSDMKIELDNELGVQTVSAETEDSTLFLAQVFPYDLAPEEAIDSLIGGMQEEFVSYGATFPKDVVSPSKRRIGDLLRNGKKLKFSLGDLRHETEIYAYRKGGKTIALMFQADHEDREEAEVYFKIIADSVN